MRNRFQEAAGIILKSWDKLLCFEILYRAMGRLYLFPFIRSRLESIPELLGVPYLGQQNVGLLLHSPPALLALTGILLLMAFYLLFEIVALLVYCEAGWRQRRISLWEIWWEGTRRTLSLFHVRRLGVLLLAVPLLLSVFSLASGWLHSVRIPEFILDHIRNTPVLFLLYASAILACHWVLFRYLFGLPAMVLGGASFSASRWESRRLLRGRGLRVLGSLLLLAVLFLSVVIVAAVTATLLLAGYAKLFYGPEQGRALFQLFLLSTQRSGAVVAGTLTAVLLSAAILVLYHACAGEPRPAAEKTRRGGWRTVLARVSSALFTLVLLLFAGETELGGPFGGTPKDAPQIVAHRAGASFAPENTLAALERAIADGADQAEIDVRQLRDGTLVLLHDSNFRRTTGVDLNVWDAEYRQIRDLDAGSFFSSGYAGEPVPTLEDALRAAKGRIRLMVELKPSGHEARMEEAALDLIRACGMEDACSIASMDEALLRRVKDFAPDIPTVYITALLISSRYDLPHVDWYSVETTSLTPGAVREAHMAGKQVYGWTANSAGTLKKLSDCEVDGIVTDNVPLAVYGSDLTAPAADFWTDLLFSA